MAMMGGRRIPALVVAAALVVPRHCGGQQVQPARPDEARAVVLAAEGVPDLELVYAGLDVVVKRAELQVLPWPLHILRSVDARAGGVWFAVDPWSRRVVARSCERHGPRELGWAPTGDVSDMLTIAEAIGIAQAEFRAREPDVELERYAVSLRLPGLTGDLVERGNYPRYCDYIDVGFTRSEGLPAGLQSPNNDRARVVIRSTSGGVWQFSRVRLEYDFEWPPRITREAATAIAVAAARREGAGFADVTRVSSALLASRRSEQHFVPVWTVSVGWLPEEHVVTGQDTRWSDVMLVDIHANTGDVLGVEQGILADPQDFRISAEQLAVYLDVDPSPRPWTIAIEGLLHWGIIHPRPHVDQAGRLFVPSWFAWLMGVRIEEDETGFLLSGVRTVRRAKDAARVIDGEAWLPLTAVAAAAEATVDWEPDQRRLHIRPTWPRYQPAPEDRSPREIDDGVGEVAR